MKTTNAKPPQLPPGLAPFDQAMRKLVKVTKSELDQAEKKYERRKRARKARKK
jgi:hypothetical protein